MVNGEERGRRRRGRTGLSERQRRVLDLLTAGKTNGEIAGDLGISLDGAKYHVREICDLVGVDTREDAAEWWRQQQGMRARFAVVRDRLGRLPAVIRWGVAGGAALAVIAVAMLAFWPRDDDGGGLDPGVWVALAVPTEPEGRLDWRVQLRPINTATGDERDIGEPAAWFWPALSPSGDRLYALEVSPGTVSNVLHLFDLTTDQAITVPWERTYAPETAVWSPDGTRLSVVTHDWAGVMTPDGALHGAAFRPEPEVGAGTGECSWAPDSSRFMCVAGDGERMVIADREGELVVFLQGNELAPPPLDTLRRAGTLTFITWLGAKDLQVIAATVDDSTREMRSWRSHGELNASEGAISWSPTEELSETDATALFEAEIARQREIAEGHGVPGGAPWGAIDDSRGGEFAGAFIGEARRSGEPAPPGSEFTFVTFVDGVRFAYPLGYLERPVTSYLFIAWDMVRVR